ncbi:MAG: cyclase family protein [Oscillibacter sp.]|nr:cyclase family protein [Oscillibacter sp.]
MIIDLTHTITADIPVYPGDPVPVLEKTASLTNSGCRLTRLSLGSHAGTHMDAPAHLLLGGATLDKLPLSSFCGRATALDVTQAGPVITADFLREQNGAIRSADFVLFYTGWEKKWGTPEYLEDGFPVLDAAAARYLVSCGLKGVGTDAPGVDAVGDQSNTAHKILLNDNMVLLESLCLKKVAGRENFRFYALPLKFQDADGAPVRAIADLRELPEKEMDAQ